MHQIGFAAFLRTWTADTRLTDTFVAEYNNNFFELEIFTNK